METRTHRPRFWVAIQPQIVKLYKVAGLVALTAILVGLVSFLVVNVFYFFDHTWVRPVVLSPSHQKVIEASTQLADAKLGASQLQSEKMEVEAKLAEIDRSIAADDQFIEVVGTTVAEPKTADDLLVRRALEQALRDKEIMAGRRAPLTQRLEALRLRLEDQDKIVRRLSLSPYLKAADHRVVLAFVPYENLNNVKIGTKLYACTWGLVACSGEGKVTAILDGEVTEMHPHDESIERGVLLEIDVSGSAAGESVLFAGSKPLWLF